MKLGDTKIKYLIGWNQLGIKCQRKTGVAHEKDQLDFNQWPILPLIQSDATF